jgi:hypothetical protein
MRLILAAALATLAAPLCAEPHQHGNVIFDVPEGWRVGGVDDTGTLTLLSDLPNDECEFCYVYIGTGIDSEMRLDSYLFSQVTRFIDDDETPTREVIMAPNVVKAEGREVALMGQLVDSDMQILFATKLSGRMEIMAFDGGADGEDELREAQTVFQRDIWPMFDTARFVSDGAAPLMPDPVPGPLSGIYWGFSTNWILGFDGMMQMDIDNRFLSFWPDGRFYDGTPPMGTRPYDPAALLQSGDPDWGSYTVDGTTLTLHFVTGEVEEIAVTADGFDDEGRAMSALTLIADGTRISGSTNDFFYTGFMPGTGVVGGLSTNSNVAYRADGTFIHEHSASAAGNFESGGDVTGGYATNSENVTQGTYDIRDGLIILTADGKEYRRHLIYDLGGDITIGETQLEPLP